MAKTQWASDWNVGVRVWVERDGAAVLGEGRAELLTAIDSEHSITKAAKAAGMSYRRAWNLIQAVNSAAGEPLVEATTGGTKGGGAQLTARGRMALAVYAQVHEALVQTAAGALRRNTASEKKAAAVVHVAAAISLQEAVGQILAQFALRRPAAQIRTIFGASNELADHLLAGAPGNLFMSAEPSQLDRLQSSRLIAADSRRLIAHNTLAAIGEPECNGIEKIRDLTKRQFKRIVLADPSCPLGKYSRKYLESSGIYETLLPKVMHVDNSRAVLAAVVSGAAQVGLAFSSDAARPGAWQILFRVLRPQFAVTYEAALIDRRPIRDDARLLLDFLASSEARRCLRRCGFRPTRR